MHHRCFKIRLFLLLLSSLLAAPLQAATRHVQDAYGQEHEVPATPKRIVTLSEIDLDSVLALGIHPIGAVNGRGQTTLPRYLPSRMQQGIAVIVISSELPEVLGLSDRVLVMHEGKLKANLVNHNLTQEQVMEAALRSERHVEKQSV